MAKKLITLVLSGSNNFPITFENILADEKVEKFKEELELKLSTLFSEMAFVSISHVVMDHPTAAPQPKQRRYKDVIINLNEVKSVTRHKFQRDPNGPFDNCYVIVQMITGNHVTAENRIRIDCDSEDDTLMVLNAIEADMKVL